MSEPTLADNPAPPVVPPRVSVLQEAMDLITGERNETYGPPTQNFTDIAAMWTVQLGHKLKPGERVSSGDVAWMMIELKAVRHKASPKRDNWADSAGYSGCGYECDVAEGVVQ